MGAAQSTAVGAPGGTFGLTRADVLKATDQPRLLVNRLFSFFAEKFAQKDLLALGNPTRCSEYIFVMADALDRLFYELRIEPGQDKKGILFFRKSAEITRAEPESAEGQQRRTLCLSLAFFYIRIFQIYASLALSVNDDASYGSGSGSGFPFAAATTGRLGAMAAPGLEGYVTSGGSATVSDTVTRGGSTDENIGKFAILKNYLTRDRSRPLGTFIFDRYPNIIINVRTEKKNLTIFKTNTTSQGPFAITCDLSIRLSGLNADKRMLTFANFKAAESSYSERLKTHGPFGLYVKKSDEYTYETDSGESVEDLIFRVLVAATDVAMGIRAPQRVRLAPGAPGAPGAPAAPGAHVNVGIPDGLKTSLILASLKKVPKPLAHCVARSLQLLNIDALSAAKLPTEVRTSICKLKFEAAQGSIPDIGREITSSPGISALQQLFFDRISSGKPTMSEESTGSYQTFVKTMAEQFAENPSSATVHLGSVINRADKMCSSTGITKKDKILTVTDTNAIRLAQQSIQTLWKFQIDHDQKVLEILSNLVVVTKVPGDGIKIGLNPLILKTGNPGVAILAKQARDLLVKYYSNCETAFRIAAIPLGAAGSPSA